MPYIFLSAMSWRHSSWKVTRGVWGLHYLGRKGHLNIQHPLPSHKAIDTLCRIHKATESIGQALARVLGFPFPTCQFQPRAVQLHAKIPRAHPIWDSFPVPHRGTCEASDTCLIIESAYTNPQRTPTLSGFYCASPGLKSLHKSKCSIMDQKNPNQVQFW